MSSGRTGLQSSKSRSLLRLVESNYGCFCCIFWTAGPFALFDNRYIIIRWNVLLKDCCVQCQDHSNGSLNICLDGIFQTIEPFVAKRWIMIVIHHQEPECLGKRLFCYHQGQGHDEGSLNQNMMFLLYLESVCQSYIFCMTNSKKLSLSVYYYQ